MSAQETSMVIRNILLLQLLTLIVIPDYAFQIHQKVLKIWKTLNTQLLPKNPADRAKKEKFWEIDMTKLEP